MKNIIQIFCLFLCVNSFSQSNFKNFKKLSKSKKWWVIWHPFKSKRALHISNETNFVTDSVARTSLLDGDREGGQVDAFRHVYWMARLRQEIGEESARSLGKAHEKDNYLMYKKNKLEDGFLPDKVSSEMDLFNNEQGLKLTKKGSKISKKSLILKIVSDITAGKMKVIKKDQKMLFVTCDGKIIDKKSLQGKWENNKCLVKSNYKSFFSALSITKKPLIK